MQCPVVNRVAAGCVVAASVRRRSRAERDWAGPRRACALTPKVHPPPIDRVSEARQINPSGLGWRLARLARSAGLVGAREAPGTLGRFRRGVTSRTTHARRQVGAMRCPGLPEVGGKIRPGVKVKHCDRICLLIWNFDDRRSRRTGTSEGARFGGQDPLWDAESAEAPGARGVRPTINDNVIHQTGPPTNHAPLPATAAMTQPEHPRQRPPAPCDTQPQRPANLVVCHQNVRGLNSKTKKLEVLLNDELLCDVFIVTEHFLRLNEIRCVTLSNFVLMSYYCRPSVEHGGSCIFVKSNIRAVNRPDYCDLSREQIFDVSAVHLIDENLLIIGIYHSNLTSDKDYLVLFDNLLAKINDDKLSAIIMGDINIDYIKNSPTKRGLKDLLSLHQFSQVVNKPTRIDNESATLLDHAYVNILRDRVSAVCIETHWSDHEAQRLTVPRLAARPESVVISKRVFSSKNKIAFADALESVDWLEIVNKHRGECVHFAMDVMNILINKFEICFPLKKTNMYQNNNSKWIDSEIIDLKLLLFDMINLSKRNPANTDLIEVTNNMLKRYNLKLKTKRTEFFDSIIQNCPNKCRGMWKAVNMELGRGSRDRVDYTDLIVDDSGNPFTSKLDLVNSLNGEFVTAAAACGAPAANTSLCLATMSSHQIPSDSSIWLRPFTPLEIVNILKKSIAPKNSTDIYGLSANLLRNVSLVICFVLSHLFNNCMRLGSYPDCLKKVKISPLYKGKGKKSAIKSYRPISLVPCISKILEVGLNRRLLAFWSSRNVLSDCQYAYRPGRSTTDLVREVVRCVVRAREGGRYVAAICCDLSRAFDTADHALVADKLAHYGIRGPALELLMSFMSGRAQVVVGDRGQVTSTELYNLMGVPQGSCLSNSLFSLLLNDLPLAVNGADIFMYADDVTAVVSTASRHELEGALNNVLDNLYRWFQANGLSLNKDKTCFIRFSLNGHPTQAMQVCAGGAPIQQVACTRLLGFNIDSALVWEAHIDELCGRLAGACFALRRLASTASGDVVRQCYFATVHSLLLYGTELWARAADWGRVFSMQKRAVRALAGVPDDVSAQDYFRKYQILPLPCLYVYQVAVFMHENIHLFKRKGANPRYNLRSNRNENQLAAEPHKLAKSERSVYYIGPEIYNRVPDELINAASIAAFKNLLNKWLHTQLFYSYDDFFKLSATDRK
ncbi:reverse transcriptase (RNA-dependent DNA polymerase) domain-containing protein [Phthorimaea operculella]|nr:reverse transcriptase (RNA-dependent DNA polymerase) domain-containing protein [Phthorimaea operculella]